MIPCTVTALNLSRFVGPLLPGSIPSSVLNLVLNDYSHDLVRGVLPPSLRELSVGPQFTGTIMSGAIPETLVKFTINGSHYDKFIPLPASTTTVYLLGPHFVKQLGPVVPPTIKSLMLRVMEGEEIPVGFLPKTGLKTLIFWTNTSRSKLTPGFFPESLEVLKFFDKFNEVILPSVLPASLKSLSFGRDFDKAIAPGVLPQGLEYLKFSEVFNSEIVKGALPETLESLTFGSCFNRPIDLPSRLKMLEVGWDYSISYPQLPKTLESLKIRGTYASQVKALQEVDWSSLTALKHIEAPSGLFNLAKTAVQFPMSLVSVVLLSIDEPVTIPNTVTRIQVVFDHESSKLITTVKNVNLKPTLCQLVESMPTLSSLTSAGQSFTICDRSFGVPCQYHIRFNFFGHSKNGVNDEIYVFNSKLDYKYLQIQ
eukprot:gene16676-19818_t